MKPTLEEFKELVKTSFAKHMPNLSDEERETYLNDEESLEVIQNEYNMSVKRLENGEITEKIFRNGSASAAAYCLYMLY